MTSKKHVTLDSIRADAANGVRLIDELFADTAHWNRLHPFEQVNPDPDGQLARMRASAKKLIAEIDRKCRVCHKQIKGRIYGSENYPIHKGCVMRPL